MYNREQCEELRSTLSKRQQDQISAERMEQLRIKEQQKMREIEDDKVYAKLWYADIEAKAKREEADTQRIMMGNKDQVEVLQQQMAALEAQKADEKRLMAEEAQLLVSLAFRRDAMVLIDVFYFTPERTATIDKN